MLNSTARPYYSQTMTTTNISIYDKGGVATLKFYPPWKGGDIMSGKPSTNLTTTGVRTANYVSGNNSDTLFFNYVVRITFILHWTSCTRRTPHTRTPHTHTLTLRVSSARAPALGSSAACRPRRVSE